MRINTFLSTLLIICLPYSQVGTNYINHKVEHNIIRCDNTYEVYLKPIQPTESKKVTKTAEQEKPVVKHEEPIKEVPRLGDADVDLISRVVMAEAENEPLDGKIYVIDTILNRVDSKYFPNTVHDVIYQANQFTSMWNGRYKKCKSNNKLNDLIQKEYVNRRNSEVVFFTAHKYGKYGRPAFVVANHYFSTYK